MVSLALVFGLALSSGGAPAPGPPTASAVRARTPSASAWGVDPVDLGRYLTASEQRAARAHARTSRRLHLVGLGTDLLWYALFLLTPLSWRLRDVCERWAAALAGRWPFRARPFVSVGRVPRRMFGPDWAGAWIFAWVYFALGTAVSLPLALLQEQAAQRAGLSTYGAAGWTWDVVKASLLQLGLFSLLVFGLYGLIRRAPRRWWLLLGLPGALALVGYGLVEPQLPRLYYDAVPLSKTPRGAALAPRLHRLAHADGVTLKRIRVLRTSRSSHRLGAAVVGLGDERELLLYDSLLAEATPREVEAAVAHELGHEREREDWVTYGAASLALLALLAGLAWILRWGGRRRGMRGAGDVATLPLVGFVIWAVFLALGPLAAWRSRGAERRADRHALTLTGDPEAVIRLQVRLARRNRSEPDPPRWAQLLWGTHPTVRERIGTARWYARWLRDRQR